MLAIEPTKNITGLIIRAIMNEPPCKISKNRLKFLNIIPKA